MRLHKVLRIGLPCTHKRLNSYINLSNPVSKKVHTAYQVNLLIILHLGHFLSHLWPGISFERVVTEIG